MNPWVPQMQPQGYGEWLLTAPHPLFAKHTNIHLFAEPGQARLGRHAPGAPDRLMGYDRTRLPDLRALLDQHAATICAGTDFGHAQHADVSLRDTNLHEFGIHSAAYAFDPAWVQAGLVEARGGSARAVLHIAPLWYTAHGVPVLIHRDGCIAPSE